MMLRSRASRNLSGLKVWRTHVTDRLKRKHSGLLRHSNWQYIGGPAFEARALWQFPNVETLKGKRDRAAGILPRNASAPIEYPNVVLLLPGSPELFDRSKTASTVDQFVSKGDPRFTIGTLDSPPGYQRLSFPPKVRQRRHSVLGGADVAPVRVQFVLVLQRAARGNKQCLYRKVGSRCSIRTTPLCTVFFRQACVK